MARSVTELQSSTPDIERLARSFARHPRAANRSPKTIRSYLNSVTGLDAFLVAKGMPRDVAAIAREHVESYIEDQLAMHKASTALVRFKSLQQFWKWCVDEGEMLSSPWNA